MKKKVTRGEFIRGLIRILMVSVLAFIAVSLGTRAVKGGQDCSGCPGKGVCGGEDDCKKYWRSPESEGRRRKSEVRSRKSEVEERNDEIPQSGNRSLKQEERSKN